MTIVMTGVMSVVAGAADRVSHAAGRTEHPCFPPARAVFFEFASASLSGGKSQLDSSKANEQVLTSTKASLSGGFLFLKGRHDPPPGQVPDLPSGRVAGGGVTPNSDSMMMAATVWHTCISKPQSSYPIYH